MKYKTTNKEINGGFADVLRVGYCDLQYLLNYESPEAYTCGRDGWHSDIYNIGMGCAISTGYAPTGSKVPYDLIRDYESRAMTVVFETITIDEKRDKLNALIKEFRVVALESIGRPAR